jgi:hypothetical protein
MRADLDERIDRARAEVKKLEALLRFVEQVTTEQLFDAKC